MLQCVRKASNALIRDFNELQVSQLKSSSFIESAYSRSAKIIRDGLYNYKNDSNFVFEGDAESEINSDYSWFLLPIDGKENFEKSIVCFAISVCLIYKNKAVAAVVDIPALKETFWAEEGKGAFLDSSSRFIKMRIGSKQRLSSCIIDCYNIDWNLLSNLLSHNFNLRIFGSIMLGFMYLALGRFDIILYSNIHKYKVLMGRLFLQESGYGKVTEKNGLVVAGNSALHQLLVSEINKNTAC